MPKSSKRTFKAIRNNYGKLEDKAVREIKLLVDKFRIAITEKLASSDWTLRNIDNLKAIVNDLTLKFQRNALSNLNGNLEKAFIKGIKQVDDVLIARKEMTVMPYLSRESLEATESYASDLIVSITREMADRVNRAVRVSLMGNKTPYQTMKDLESFIPPLRSRKRVGSAFARAENIVRTQMGYINNNANLERMQMVAEKNPGYGKKWFGSHKSTSRPAHMAMEELGVVPMDYVFVVNGHRCQGPHDMSLPAEEVCKCGCTLIMDKLPEEKMAA